jgi:hypothetical protein
VLGVLHDTDKVSSLLLYGHVLDYMPDKCRRFVRISQNMAIVQRNSGVHISTTHGASEQFARCRSNKKQVPGSLQKQWH